MTDAPPPTPPTEPPAGATPPPAGATPPPGGAAPAAPAYQPAPPKPAKPQGPETLFWRRPDRTLLTAALTAVLIGWAIHLVVELLRLIANIGFVFDFGTRYLAEDFGAFAFYGLWRALWFFGPVFVALWLLLPIAKESPLPVVLKRVAVASLAGLAGLLLFGLVEAIFNAVVYRYGIGSFGATFFWYSLQDTIVLGAFAAVGAVIAWLRAHRPPKPAAPAAAPAAPAATPPAPPAPPAA